MLFPKLLPITKVIVGVAICVSSVPAVANPSPCIAGAQGCVLPLRDAIVAQPVVEQPVAVVPVVEPAILEEPKGFPLLALLGLAAAAVAAYLLLTGEDGEAEPLSP
jgi:hypothetical protein